MAFQFIKAEAPADLMQRWSQFAQKCADGAARGDAFCVEHAANVVTMVGETGRLRRELDQAREQEKKMDLKIQELEKSLQEHRNAVAAAQDEKADETNTSKTIDEVFESQQGYQTVMESKLDAITTNLMAMKKEIEKQSSFNISDVDSTEALRPEKRRRVEDYVVRQNHRAQSVELNDDEQCRLDDFIEKYSYFIAILKEIVPCQSAPQWDPNAIMRTLQDICFGSTGSAANITNFMSTRQEPAWHCARRVASEGANHFAVLGKNGFCMTCRTGCLQICPLEPDGRPGRHRVRFIHTQIESLFGSGFRRR